MAAAVARNDAAEIRRRARHNGKEKLAQLLLFSVGFVAFVSKYVHLNRSERDILELLMPSRGCLCRSPAEEIKTTEQRKSDDDMQMRTQMNSKTVEQVKSLFLPNDVVAIK